jgi:REase_DpnII-MboI
MRQVDVHKQVRLDRAQQRNANLRKAIHAEPTAERDVQNAIESLLIGKGMQKGIDYDRETGRVKHAGKESIPDFVFRTEQMVLEVKFCNRAGKLAEIIDEMNADIVAYSTVYERVWFLIHDMGLIRDEDELVRGLQKSANVKCVVVKH